MKRVSLLTFLFLIYVSETVFLNEIHVARYLPDSDWIEIWNNDRTSGIDITGWSISSLNGLRTYTFPNTTLGPDAYIVLDQSRLGFHLNPSGDSLILKDDQSTSIHSISFPATPESSSFIRYQTTDSVEHWILSQTMTKGSPNSNPRIGPIAVIEIMFDPLPGDDQYIVIENTNSRTAYNLFLDNYPTVVWSIGGSINYNYPRLTTLGPLKKLIITSASSVDDFRTKHNVPSYVQVFNDWPSQSLPTQSGSIVLLRPDLPDLTTNLAPYYQIEAIDYKSTPPWPQISQGTSIVRKNTTTYSNEPTLWSSSSELSSRISEPDGTPTWVQPQVPKLQNIVRQLNVDRGVIVEDSSHPIQRRDNLLWVYLLIIVLLAAFVLIGLVYSLTYQITHQVPKMVQSVDD